MRLRTLVVAAAAVWLAGPSACQKGGSDASNPPAEDASALDDAAVVDNPKAKPGDVTICPYSGKKFVVKAEHPTMQWGSQTYVFCSDFAKREVEKDPEKYLGPAG